MLWGLVQYKSVTSWLVLHKHKTITNWLVGVMRDRPGEGRIPVVFFKLTSSSKFHHSSRATVRSENGRPLLPAQQVLWRPDKARCAAPSSGGQFLERSFELCFFVTRVERDTLSHGVRACGQWNKTSSTFKNPTRTRLFQKTVRKYSNTGERWVICRERRCSTRPEMFPTQKKQHFYLVSMNAQQDPRLQ